MWEYARSGAIWAVGLYTLSKLGPPAVDKYFLPTIEYVAGTFHAVAPQPAPATTFVHMQTPIAADPTPTILKTVFVRKAADETMPLPEAATITGINNGQWPFHIYEHGSKSSSQDFYNDSSPECDGLFYESSPLFEWYSRMFYEASHTVLLQLRQLLDSFLYQVMTFTGLIISWKILKYRNQMNVKNITALHELEIFSIQQECSALAVVKDLEITSLIAQNQSQRDELHTLQKLLEEANEESRLANESKKLAEEQSKTETAKLNSCLTDKDSAIAERNDGLAKATERAEKAEKSQKILESNARKSRSDFDSALQKKENDINTHKRASEQATKDGDTASRELKDARVQAGKDKKKVTELEKQVADFTKKTAKLEAQVKERDASIGRKDGMMTNLREEKQQLIKNVEDMTAERDRALKDGSDVKVKDGKLIGELQAQITEANNLRKFAEAKTSEHQALATKEAEQREAAEGRARQQETRASEAEASCKAAEEKASQQEAKATEVIEQLKTKDEKIATLKADSNSSYRYLQGLVDTAQEANAGLSISLDQAIADAQRAEAEAQETQEALQERITELQERIAELEEQHQEKPVWSDTAAPGSSSSQERPIVRLPGSNTEQTGPYGSENRPVPRWEPPAKGKTKTPPEERGLPANTPTGPKAGRGGGLN